MVRRFKSKRSCTSLAVPTVAQVPVDHISDSSTDRLSDPHAPTGDHWGASGALPSTKIPLPRKEHVVHAPHVFEGHVGGNAGAGLVQVDELEARPKGDDKVSEDGFHLKSILLGEDIEKHEVVQEGEEENIDEVRFCTDMARVTG